MGVFFDRNTAIKSTAMDGYFTSGGYTTGIITYCFNSNATSSDAGILQIYQSYAGTGNPSLSALRLEHNLGYISNGLSLYLQQTSGINTTYSRLAQVLAQDFVQFYDGKWHLVMISWNIGINPAVVNISIDGLVQPVYYTRIFGDTGTLQVVGPSFAGGPITWGIGYNFFEDGDSSTYPYLGCLESFTVQLGNSFLDVTSQQYCDLVAVALATSEAHMAAEPVMPIGSTLSYFLCRTIIDKINSDFINPTHSQLVLAGGKDSFPINYAPGPGRIANPFGLSTTFSTVRGALQDSPTNPPFK